MDYRFKPQLPQEKELARQIHESLQGDIIDQIMEATGVMENADDSELRTQMSVSHVKVDPDMLPHLYSLVQEVRNTLGFEREIELYITNSQIANACTLTETTPGRPLIINLYSALVNIMTDDELRFVIGHELGHQIDGNFRLSRLVRFVYPDMNPEMSPLLLQLKYNCWKQLCELVADRYGFLAVNNLEACLSAFFKLQSGLNLHKADLNMQAFLKRSYTLLKHFTEGEYLSLGSGDHPVDAIRAVALDVFANYQSQKELDEAMSVLTHAITRLSTTEMDNHLPYFIASAGLLIASADGKITEDEEEYILEHISSYDLFPKKILEEVRGGDYAAYFDKSVEEILKLNPDMKPRLMQFIIDQVITDKRLDVNEISLMIKIGVDYFGYPQEQVISAFAEAIRAKFRPAFSSIC